MGATTNVKAKLYPQKTPLILTSLVCVLNCYVALVSVKDLCLVLESVNVGQRPPRSYVQTEQSSGERKVGLSIPLSTDLP